MRRSEYYRLSGKDKAFVKGQWYTLLYRWENLSLGFVKGVNTKIRVIQRQAYGLRDEEYLRLKVLPCMLPEI